MNSILGTALLVIALLTIGLLLPPAVADAQDADKDEQNEACQKPELRKELLDRMEADQKARFELLDWMKANAKDGQPANPPALILKRVTEIDEKNRTWLGQIVEKHGWPTYDLVGKDGAHAAWLLVQHSDRDPKFQDKCLELMKACDEDQVAQIDIAYLEDRVRLAKGDPQVYGTQVEQKDGKWQVRSVVDPEKLDERRKKVGLPPFAEYLELVRKMQQPKEQSEKESGK